VRPLAVLSEPLSVIGGDGDEQPPDRPRARGRQDAAEARVRVGDLALVRAARERLALRRGRVVRSVRVVEVHPREERPRLLADPGLGGGRDLAAAPLGLQDGGALHVALDAVVVAVEAARETEAPVQHVRADERAGRVPARLQHGRERPGLRGEHVRPVVVHAVVRRLQPGEDRRVGRQGQRHRRPGVLHHEALGRQRVDLRRPARTRAVDAHPVGAQRVDRDQEDARRRLR
jgi:hypothetical protein